MRGAAPDRAPPPTDDGHLAGVGLKGKTPELIGTETAQGQWPP